MMVRTSSASTDAPAGLEVEALVRAALQVGEADRAVGRAGAVGQADDVLDARRGRLRGLADLRQELLLAHHHPVAGIAEQVGDLLRRQGVVDRERGATGVQGRGVGEVELHPVGQHQPHRLAAVDAERGQALGQPPHAGAVLPPGEALRALGVAQGESVRMRGDGLLEGLGEGGWEHDRILSREEVARPSRPAASAAASDVRTVVRGAGSFLWRWQVAPRPPGRRHVGDIRVDDRCRQP